MRSVKAVCKIVLVANPKQTVCIRATVRFTCRSSQKEQQPNVESQNCLPKEPHFDIATRSFKTEFD